MPPPDENPPVPDPHMTRVHPLNCVTVTENKPCQEAANPKVRPPSATPNDRPATARHKDDRPTPVVRVRYRRPADRRSRPQRWDDAVAELLTLQAEYTAWHDALPDGFRDTAIAETLQAIADLDLTELQAIIPPRGFGRD
jgi:hypothetical protein